MLVVVILFSIMVAFTVIYSISVFLTLNISKKDEAKFKKYLTKKCQKELIYIQYHKDIHELNRCVFGEVGYKKMTAWDLANGVYQYDKGKSDALFNLKNKLPKIHLSAKSSFSKATNTMTFAHELGHHFAIKLYNDHSEDTANQIAVELFKDCFSWFHRIKYFQLLTMYSTNNIFKKTKTF